MTVDVAVVEDVWGEAFERLSGDLEVVFNPKAWESSEELLALAHEARALVVRNRTQVDRTLLEACPALLIVGRAGVGLDNIDLAGADELGVAVVAPRGANATSVAEHAIALALVLARHVVELDRACRDGGWQRVPGRELSGGTWGVLGAGATARATARAAKALGMQVVAYDPYVSPDHPEMVEIGLRLASLDEVVSTADILSCHLPATEATRNLVGARLLAQTKPTALFINLGRGEVVDEDALADAVEEGRLAGAGLDVRAEEPPTPGRLERLGSVVLTPHVAGITEQSQARILQVLADDIRSVLAGGEARNAVGAVRAGRRLWA
jgi:D-3-phosphoglycerate dehydrogenase / 2-oxoglutarate reductase